MILTMHPNMYTYSFMNWTHHQLHYYYYYYVNSYPQNHSYNVCDNTLSTSHRWGQQGSLCCLGWRVSTASCLCLPIWILFYSLFLHLFFFLYSFSVPGMLTAFYCPCPIGSDLLTYGLLETWVFNMHNFNFLFTVT